eukprot:TRINITY_DN11086_c0_g1_i2.p1 TRINITY_DN11086_c0_g1~~TRINITY_DN11086_c0_g1_i2.p1  ORF type:complete len:1784 (-),score=423.23 TRINITY_DN11086_c0_g1_i2:68-5419(-)
MRQPLHSDEDRIRLVQSKCRVWLARQELRRNHGIRQLGFRNLKIGEIISTERTYVGCLRVLIEIFYVPLTALSKATAIPIPIADLDTVFASLRPLLEIHSALLARLLSNRTSLQPFLVGQVFIDIAANFEKYTAYVNTYNERLSVLGAALNKPVFKEHVHALEASPRCGGLSLYSFLITPVQRIPRYQLLLQDVLKCTPESHKDHALVKEALARVAAVGSLINESKRDADNYQQVLELERAFIGDLRSHIVASAARRLVKMGALAESGSRNPERCRWFLFNDQLVYGEAITQNRAEMCVLKAVLSLQDLAVTNAPSKGEQQHRFLISNADTMYMVTSTSEEEKQTWMSVITSVATGSSDMSANAEVLIEGFMSKQGDWNKAFRQRWFVIKDDALNYYRQQKDRSPAGKIPLSQSSLHNDAGLAFHITTSKGRTYELKAENPQEKQLWMRSIRMYLAGYDLPTMAAHQREMQLLEAERAAEAARAPTSPIPPATVTMRAMFDFMAQESDELTIHAGDLLEVTETGGTGDWLFGYNGTQSGLFPASYVESLPETDTDVVDRLQSCVTDEQLSGLDDSSSLVAADAAGNDEEKAEDSEADASLPPSAARRSLFLLPILSRAIALAERHKSAALARSTHALQSSKLSRFVTEIPAVPAPPTSTEEPRRATSVRLERPAAFGPMRPARPSGGRDTHRATVGAGLTTSVSLSDIRAVSALVLAAPSKPLFDPITALEIAERRNSPLATSAPTAAEATPPEVTTNTPAKTSTASTAALVVASVTTPTEGGESPRKPLPTRRAPIPSSPTLSAAAAPASADAAEIPSVAEVPSVAPVQQVERESDVAPSDPAVGDIPVTPVVVSQPAIAPPVAVASSLPDSPTARKPLPVVPLSTPPPAVPKAERADSATPAEPERRTSIRDPPELVQHFINPIRKLSLALQRRASAPVTSSPPSRGSPKPLPKKPSPIVTAMAAVALPPADVSVVPSAAQQPVTDTLSYVSLRSTTTAAVTPPPSQRTSSPFASATLPLSASAGASAMADDAPPLRAAPVVPPKSVPSATSPQSNTSPPSAGGMAMPRTITRKTSRVSFFDELAEQQQQSPVLQAEVDGGGSVSSAQMPARAHVPFRRVSMQLPSTVLSSLQQTAPNTLSAPATIRQSPSQPAPDASSTFDSVSQPFPSVSSVRSLSSLARTAPVRSPQLGESALSDAPASPAVLRRAILQPSSDQTTGPVPVLNTAAAVAAFSALASRRTPIAATQRSLNSGSAYYVGDSVPSLPGPLVVEDVYAASQTDESDCDSEREDSYPQRTTYEYAEEPVVPSPLLGSGAPQPTSSAHLTPTRSPQLAQRTPDDQLSPAAQLDDAQILQRRAFILGNTIAGLQKQQRLLNQMQEQKQQAALLLATTPQHVDVPPRPVFSPTAATHGMTGPTTNGFHRTYPSEHSASVSFSSAPLYAPQPPPVTLASYMPRTDRMQQTYERGIASGLASGLSFDIPTNMTPRDYLMSPQLPTRSTSGPMPTAEASPPKTAAVIASPISAPGSAKSSSSWKPRPHITTSTGLFALPTRAMDELSYSLRHNTSAGAASPISASTSSPLPSARSITRSQPATPSQQLSRHSAPAPASTRSMASDGASPPAPKTASKSVSALPVSASVLLLPKVPAPAAPAVNSSAEQRLREMEVRLHQMEWQLAAETHLRERLEKTVVSSPPKSAPAVSSPAATSPVHRHPLAKQKATEHSLKGLRDAMAAADELLTLAQEATQRGDKRAVQLLADAEQARRDVLSLMEMMTQTFNMS